MTKSRNWKEIDGFGRLIGWVANAHRNERTAAASNYDRELFDAVAANHYEMTDTDLASMLPTATDPIKDWIARRQYVLLRQLRAGQFNVQPILTLSTRMATDTHFKASVCVAFAFRKWKENTEDAQASLTYVAYRFESPEGPGTGEHDFYHAQHITTIQRGRPLNPPWCHLSWMPETQPSFPLSARCLVSFGLSIFLTLYGAQFLGEIATSATGDYTVEMFRKFAFPPKGTCVTNEMSLPGAVSSVGKRRAGRRNL